MVVNRGQDYCFSIIAVTSIKAFFSSRYFQNEVKKIHTVTYFFHIINIALINVHFIATTKVLTYYISGTYIIHRSHVRDVVIYCSSSLHISAAIIMVPLSYTQRKPCTTRKSC